MDTVAVEELHQAVDPLVEDAILHLVLDLREVDYVSSSVLQFLIETQDRMKKKGGRTSLVGAGSLVRSVIETARVDSLFGFYETLEELGSPRRRASLPRSHRRDPRANPPRQGLWASQPQPRWQTVPPRPGRGSPPGGPRRSSPSPARSGTPHSGASGAGLAALIAASLAWSLYLYLTRYGEVSVITERIPNEALVVRGGRNRPIDIVRGTGTHRVG